MERKPEHPIKRRRYPLSKLIDGKSQTIISECGPVVVSTKHEDGQLLVVVDVPAEHSDKNSANLTC